MSSKSYKKGVIALREELNSYLSSLPDSESAEHKLYVLTEFAPNKFDREFVDAKVKNVYYKDADKYVRLEEFKSLTVCQCLLYTHLRTDGPKDYFQYY